MHTVLPHTSVAANLPEQVGVLYLWPQPAVVPVLEEVQHGGCKAQKGLERGRVQVHQQCCC